MWRRQGPGHAIRLEDAVREDSDAEPAETSNDRLEKRISRLLDRFLTPTPEEAAEKAEDQPDD